MKSSENKNKNYETYVVHNYKGKLIILVPGAGPGGISIFCLNLEPKLIKNVKFS